MNYFKYLEEEEQVINLIELDKDFFCHRAIFIEKNKVYTTNKVDKENKYFLPEGSFQEFIDHLEEISFYEFISIWKKANWDLGKNLQRISREFPKGKKLKAKIICFYPQGVVLDCGDAFNGIAQYEDCLDEFGKDKMYPNQILDLIVSGIDSENLMIELETITNYNNKELR